MRVLNSNLDEKIQMVDLKGQYENIKEAVNASIQEVLDTNTYINGPEVHKFQKSLEDYLGKTRNSVCQWNGCFANCHDGARFKTWRRSKLRLIYVCGNCGSDCFITVDLVLVDVELILSIFQSKQLKRQLIKTKAIVPVHLFGQAPDMEAIMQLASEHNLYVIEDNAQAIGADYKYFDGKKKKAGVIGHVASTSFFSF